MAEATVSLRALARQLGGDVAGRGGIVIPGPGHSKHDRSLKVTLDPAAPDGFVVHSFAHDDFRVCRDYVRERLGLVPSWRRYPECRTMPLTAAAPIEQQSAEECEDPPTKNRALALSLWNEGVDPRGTVVEARLRRRGIELDVAIADRAIRYHPRLWHKARRQYLPAMLALFRRIDDDVPVAIQRTYIGPDGRKIGDRMMLGPVAGGAIKLDADHAVTTGLAVGEGLETTMTGRMAGFAPAWVLGSTSNIAAFAPLPGIEALTVFAEVDQNGASEKALNECAPRWLAAGREVITVTPRRGKDLNDLVRRDAK
jgi:hypothetical protein